MNETNGTDTNDMTDTDDAPEVDFSIEQLVLHGLTDINPGSLERAFRQELGRLLTAEPPRRSTEGAVDLRRPLELHLAPGGTSQQVGHQLAEAIHGAVRR